MKTALYDRHVALGAKIVDFAGWQMPVRYEKGTLVEHKAVRERAGLFDVSHMGRISVTGPDAEKLLDYLSTNRIAGKKDGAAIYTVWANEQGGSVDDLIVYRRSATDCFVVANASNRDKDLTHLQRFAEKYDVVVTPFYEGEAILALQGPEANRYMEELLPAVKELRFMSLGTFEYKGEQVVVSRTGYTGEKGYEIFCSDALAGNFWDQLISAGVEPIGLAARDTLRLEMGFALYGHELSDEIAATESVSAWTVKLDKEEFVGQESLCALEKSDKKRRQYPVVIQGKGIGREGSSVLSNGERVGEVTSGTMSPSLQQPIALVMVEGDFATGDQLEVEVRGKRLPAVIVALPFFKSLCKK